MSLARKRDYPGGYECCASGSCEVVIGYTFPGGDVKLPYAQMRVEPAQLQGERRQSVIDRLVEELTEEVGIERAENGKLHLWSDTLGLKIVRLVSAP